MKAKFSWYVVEGDLCKLADMPDVKNPECMVIATFAKEDIAEIVATLKAKKGRGKFKYEMDKQCVHVYTGKLARIYMPYMFGKHDKECYQAIHCHPLYIPSIIEALEKLK